MSDAPQRPAIPRFKRPTPSTATTSNDNNGTNEHHEQQPLSPPVAEPETAPKQSAPPVPKKPVPPAPPRKKPLLNEADPRLIKSQMFESPPAPPVPPKANSFLGFTKESTYFLFNYEITNITYTGTSLETEKSVVRIIINIAHA